MPESFSAAMQAQVLATAPQAMQLRYLATLYDIAGERSSTIVFPFPIDLFKQMMPESSGRPGAGG
jgi:hypothetical protein